MAEQIPLPNLKRLYGPEIVSHKRAALEKKIAGRSVDDKYNSRRCFGFFEIEIAQDSVKQDVERVLRDVMATMTDHLCERFPGAFEAHIDQPSPYRNDTNFHKYLRDALLSLGMTYHPFPELPGTNWYQVIVGHRACCLPEFNQAHPDLAEEAEAWTISSLFGNLADKRRAWIDAKTIAVLKKFDDSAGARKRIQNADHGTELARFAGVSVQDILLMNRVNSRLAEMEVPFRGKFLVDSCQWVFDLVVRLDIDPPGAVPDLPAERDLIVHAAEERDLIVRACTAEDDALIVRQVQELAGWKTGK